MSAIKQNGIYTIEQLVPKHRLERERAGLYPDHQFGPDSQCRPRLRTEQWVSGFATEILRLFGRKVPDRHLIYRTSGRVLLRRNPGNSLHKAVLGYLVGSKGANNSTMEHGDDAVRDS